MRTRLLLLTLPLAMLLMACPYKSKVSLSETDTSTFDKRLNGAWECVDEDGTKYNVFVRKAESNLYGVMLHTWDGEGEDQGKEEHRAHFTPELGMINWHNADSSFQFFHFTYVDKEEFSLRPVGEDFVKNSLSGHETATQQQMFEFVQSNLSNDAMYEETMNFYKVGSKRHARKAKEWGGR